MPTPRLSDILDQVAAIAAEVVAPNAARVDEEARWPEEGLRALQKAVGGLAIRQAHGGLGHGLHALTRVCEILGRECASTAICFGMHCVGVAAIDAKATPQQVERYLLPIREGRHLTTLSLSEPGTGAHFYVPQSRLSRAPDGSFVVNGTKTFVTNGSYADSYVVSTAASSPDAPPGSFSLVMVPNDAEGIRWGPPWAGLGMRGNSSLRLDLEDVAVPADDLLGREGDQIWYVFNVIAPCFLAAMAGTYLGIADAALQDARAHLRTRRHEHSGTSLAEQTVVQHRLGGLWAEVERTRRLVYHATEAADSGDAGALPAVLSAKAEVADCVERVVNDAMSLMGGISYRDNSAMSRRLRDARASHVMAPTTDLLRIWTGRALLDLPLLGD